MSRSIFSNQWIGIEADSSGNRLDSRWVDAGHVRASTPHSCARVCTRVIELPESKSNNIALIGYTQQTFVNGQWASWDRASRSVSSTGK